MNKEESPEAVLRDTKSLYQYKQALWLLLRKFKRPDMTEEDYRTPSPLALCAYRDGQKALIKTLDLYLKEPDNG